MTSLLSIASRIEAAVATYVSVRDVTDRAEWKHHFDEEKAKTTRIFRQIRKDDSGEAPALHPMLAVLYIVLDADGDHAEITRTYPRLNKHRYYQPGARFPQDISDLLPSEDRWWEILAAKSRNAAAPPNAVAHSLPPGLPRVRILPPKPPADYVVMELPRATRNRKKSKTATKAAANSRKRKRASPPGGKTKKRHTGSSRLQPRPAHQDEDEYKSEDEEEEEEDDGEYEDVIEIEDEGEDEDEDKIGDGDEEKDELEGEDDMDEDEIEERKQYKFEVFKFHLDQLKGKQPMCKPGEGSDSVTLASRMVGKMTLDSGSSHGHSRSAASHSPSIAESPVPPSAEPSPVPHSAAASRPPTPPAEPSVLAAAPLAPSPPAASIPIPDDTPAITPSLCRRLVPRPPDAVPDVLVRGLSGHSAPSQEQSSAAQASQVPSPGSSGMEALERRVAAIEEWIRAQDKNWKGSL
ncbi:hypothetical protein EDB85DRAFT_2145449 [Lactarius pseudohatsudake]|nr:hypothetical protein EDB85DRAFT_2145449 [Lactarius pseudohatsudake]